MSFHLFPPARGIDFHEPLQLMRNMPFADQRQLEIYVKLTVKNKLWPNQSMFKSHNHERKCTVKGDTHMHSFNRLPYCASPKKLFSPTVCPSTSAGLWYWTLWLAATRPRITDQHTFLGYHDSCLSHEAKRHLKWVKEKYYYCSNC